MAVTVTHPFVSAVLDGADLSVVRPIDWNATHSLTGTVDVANGGTGASTASITSFNNITGYTAAGATGTTSTNLVFSASPTFTGTLAAAAITASTTLDVTGTSTLSGNAIISVTDNTNAALRITQLGTGNALLVEDSANPDATPFVVTADGRIVSGLTAPVRNASLTIASDIATAPNGAIDLRNSTNTPAETGILFFDKSRGTLAAPTSIQNNDSLGILRFSGYDGVGYIDAASILAQVDNTPGTNDMPGRLIFSTTADGASSTTERMRIDSTGQTTISGNAIISVTDNTNAALRITQLGTGNALLVEDTTNPDASPLVIDSDGGLIIGYTIKVGTGPVASTPSLQNHGLLNSSSSAGLYNWSSTASRTPSVQFGKSISNVVGTRGAITTIGTALGSISFTGDDGTNFIEGANISAFVDGTPGTNDMPGRFVFSTTADGASTPTERMRIDSSGQTTISGNAIISVTDNTNAALRITQLGTGNALLVEDTTNPDASPFVIDASGRVIVGYTSSQTVIATGLLQINGTTDAHQSIARYTTNSTSPTFNFGKSRGASVGSLGVVVNGDGLGTISFAGDDGVAFISAASIASNVDGTPGTNDMPGRLVFSTTADGASTPTERMRISSSGNVGIGGAGTAGVNLDIRKIITGAVSAFGVNVQATIQSDVTTTTSSFQTYPSTAAAAFTLTSLRHFDADQGTIGVGSTVTNQYGFRANSSLTGATNNYGFYSNIASAANRYNFYANGTAENFFGGNTVISVTDNTNAALRITQLGTGNALLVEDSANPDSTSFVVGPSGEVGIRMYASAIPANIALMVNGDDGNSRVVFQRSDAMTGGAQLFMRKARGSLAAPTIVASGDTAGKFSFSGFDGTNYLESANIFSEVDGTPGTNDMPGRLIFSTTADGASSPTERMRIDSSGNVGIGGTPTAGVTLQIAKSITGSTVAWNLYNTGTIQSGVTTQAKLYVSNPSTAAAVFALNVLTHYLASQGTIGAGSTVVNQYGFEAFNTLIGATNNYGFYGNIAAAANRFNFYAAGTADNYFAGSVGIGLAPTTKLQVYGAGTTAAFYTNGDASGSTAFLQSSGGAAGDGGQILFGASFGVFAGIKALLTNGTGPAGDLVFQTRTTSGNVVEQIRIEAGGNVGVGGTAGADTSLGVLGTFKTSAAVSRVVRAFGTIPSATTTTARAFGTDLSTEAAAFTLSSLQHFAALQSTIGASSAVTNQIGFLAESNLTGATNNYGFYSNIAAAANRWNFYANGTARNYMAADLTVNGATAIPAGGTAGAGLMVSSTANFGVFFGSGAPTLSAAKGSLYLRSDGSTVNDRMYVNTNGSTTWTSVATSA